MQYSALSARQSVHKLCTSCIRRGLVSRDLIVDGNWLPATDLSVVLSTRVRRRRKLGDVSCVERTGQQTLN